MNRHEQLRQEVVAFHQRHPEVWDLFVKFTFERINAGFEHYSARGIWHRIRWETAAPIDRDEDDFKLNDHHTPFYARQFMKVYPQHNGFFRTRVQRSKGQKGVTLSPLKPRNFV